MGFSVVNVDYRVARVALAPAAVEDARCALRWVIRHAPQYGFDRSRMVLVGSSAGAHLALMAAMAPASAGFDRLCPGDEPLTVAAVINFFGVVDVAELLAPPNPRDFAIGWLGPGAGDAKLVERLSPLGYVDKRAPAILTLHGDADPVVPFTQATRLHAALDAAGVANRLVPIRGGTPRQLRRQRGAARQPRRARVPGQARHRVGGAAVRREEILRGDRSRPLLTRPSDRGPSLRRAGAGPSAPGPRPAPPAWWAGSAWARGAGSRPAAPAARRRTARRR